MSVKSVQDVAFGGSFRITSILYSQTEYNRVSEYGVDELLRGETYVREKSVHIHGKGEGVVVGLLQGNCASSSVRKGGGKIWPAAGARVSTLELRTLQTKREKEREEELSFIFVTFREIKKKKIENLLKKFIASNIN